MVCLHPQTKKDIIAGIHKFFVLGLAITLPLISVAILLVLMRYSAKPVLAHSCEAYPIALDENIINSLQPNDIFAVFEGGNPGNYRWLVWDPHPSNNNANYLATELQNPTLSLTDFTDMNDPTDHSLSSGDDIWVMLGILNSADVDNEIHNLINSGLPIRGVVYDAILGPVSNPYAHASSFIMVKFTDYTRSSQTVITFTYLGPADDPESCRDFGLSLTPSQSQAGSPGQRLTYTHTLTNEGHYTETAALTYTTSLTDWPVSLSLISQTLAPGQAITLTAAITIPTDTPTEITHTTHLTAALPVNPAISATAVDTTTVLTPHKLFLPLILKQ